MVLKGRGRSDREKVSRDLDVASSAIHFERVRITAPEKIFKIVQDKRVWVAYRHL